MNENFQAVATHQKLGVYHSSKILSSRIIGDVNFNEIKWVLDITRPDLGMFPCESPF